MGQREQTSLLTAIARATGPSLCVGSQGAIAARGGEEDGLSPLITVHVYRRRVRSLGNLTCKAMGYEHACPLFQRETVSHFQDSKPASSLLRWRLALSSKVAFYKKTSWERWSGTKESTASALMIRRNARRPWTMTSHRGSRG